MKKIMAIGIGIALCGVVQAALYETDFEDFTLGSIDNNGATTEGW